MIQRYPNRHYDFDAFAKPGIVKPTLTSWYNLHWFKFRRVEHSSDAVLTIADLLKIHLMDVSGGDRSFTLPATTAQDLGKWIILVRKGTGNDLAILAPVGEKIFNSSAGGRVVCADSHDYAALWLFLADVGQWTDPSFGVWNAY